MSDDDIDEMVRQLAAEVATMEQSSQLAATVLERVKSHMESHDATAQALLDHVDGLFRAARDLLLQTVDSRKKFAAEVGLPADTVAVLPDAPAPDDDPVVGEAMPNVAALSATCGWLKWAFEDALPKCLKDDAELRSAAFLRMLDDHGRLQRELEDQAGVLADAQAALETAASRLDSLRAEEGELEAQIKHLDTETTELDDAKATLDSAPLVAELDETQSALGGVRRQVEDAQIAIRAAERERQEVQEALNTELSQADDAEKRVAELREAGAKSKLELQRKIGQAESLEGSAAALEREMAATRASAAAAEDEALMHERKLDETRAAAERVLADLRTSKRGLSELQQELSDKEDRLKEGPARIKQANTALDELVRRRAALRQKFADETVDAEAAEGEASRAEERARYLESLLPKHHPLRRQVSAAASRSSTPAGAA